MSHLISLLGQKGGNAKSVTSHLICLGAILRRQPAAYVLTDARRQLKAAGRPYGVLDGRDPAKLAAIMTANQASFNGWLVIDGGGNRPDFDRAIAAQVDLCLLPFRDSEEDLEMVAADLAAIPESFAWPSAWPTNVHAAQSAKRYIDALKKAFPNRVIEPPIYFVNSAKELLDASLGEPSTQVRTAAKRAFGIMEDHLDAQRTPAKTAMSA